MQQFYPTIGWLQINFDACLTKRVLQFHFYQPFDHHIKDVGKYKIILFVLWFVVV